MIKSRILSALIGLVGAIQNNGKTENTDSIIKDAILNINDKDLENEIIEKIHNEKFVISPNCRTCDAPCGNTSDFNIEKLCDNTDEVLKAKEKLISSILDSVKSDSEISDLILKGISYIAYDLPVDMYNELIELIEG